MFNSKKNKTNDKNKLNKKEIRTEDLIDRGSSKINDLIAPDSITNEKTFYVIGNRLTRTLIVTGYPRTVYMGWLEPLYSYDANVDISTHITPWPTVQVIKTLNKRIGQYLSTINMDERDGSTTDVEVTSALEDAEHLRQILHDGDSKFFYQSLYITVSARYLEELDQLTEDIESLCGSASMTTRIATYRQNQAFLSVLPIGDDQIKKTRNFETSSLSTCFPLVSAELTNTNGNPILYGINRINNSLVMFDRFRLNNFNSVTLATSGAGKSYTVKLEIIRYFLMGTKIIVIDPQGEYKKITSELGGQYIELSSYSKDVLNPLDVYENAGLEEDGKSFLTTKVMDVLLMIRVMLGSERKLTNTEGRVILNAVQNMYARFGITVEGITKENDDFFLDKEFITVGSEKQRMPTLSDLDTALKEMGEEGILIAQDLEPYVTGVMNIFNGETNVNLDNNFIVFGIKDLEEGLKDIAMFISLEYIWNRVKAGDLQRRLIVVDEAWMLMKNKASASFLEKVARTARKFNAGLSVISQNVKDFIDNGGEAIITNTSMQVLLRQKPKELGALEEALGITESEKMLLRTADIGEAIIYAEQNKTSVKIVANAFEDYLCNSNAEN